MTGKQVDAIFLSILTTAIVSGFGIAFIMHSNFKPKRVQVLGISERYYRDASDVGYRLYVKDSTGNQFFINDTPDYFKVKSGQMKIGDFITIK